MNVGQAELSSLVAEGQPGVIDPQGVQDRRLQVMDVRW
jgi:hypothetical protein